MPKDLLHALSCNPVKVFATQTIFKLMAILSDLMLKLVYNPSITLISNNTSSKVILKSIDLNI